MDSWKRFDETLLPEKENFYSNINMDVITDANYKHAKKLWKNFKIKNLGYYHDLYVQGDALLLVDVFENFRNKCHYLSAPGLAWQLGLKKTEVESKLLSDIDMLLMVEKEITGGIYHAIHRYAAANDEYMKNYDKDK